MLAPDVFVKASAAAATGVFGILVLTAAPGTSANRFLGAFLLMLTGNQAAEAIRAVAPASEGDLWLGVATVFGCLDPLFIAYATGLFPRRNALQGRAVVAVLLVTTVAFTASVPFLIVSRDGPTSRLAELALALLTAAVYTMVLAQREGELVSPSRDPTTTLLFLGAAVMAVPTWSRVLRATGLWVVARAPAASLDPWRFAALLAPLAVLAVILLAARRRGDPASRRSILVCALVGVAFSVWIDGAALVDVVSLARTGATHPTLPIAAVSLLSAGLSGRIVFFVAALSIAILRHDALQIPPTARRNGARALVAIGIAGLALAGLLLARAVLGVDGGLSFAEVFVVFIAVATSQAFRVLVDETVARVYGIPRRRSGARAIETYREAAVAVAAQGRPVALDVGLARLREGLGIDLAAASVVDRLAEASAGGPLEAGRVIGGRYRVLRLLGRGGSGRAFLATDELLKREIVLKELFDDQAGDLSIALREARIAGGLHHPNVVTVYDAIERTNGILLVTEYVAGGSLEERLALRPLEEREFRVLGEGLLAGLEAVHDQRIVHRDLKPANILIDDAGRPKIADFGIARVRRGMTGALDSPVVVEGTPEFMAPEQRRGEPAQAPADIYAVGLILQRAVTSAPPALGAVLARALRDDPRARWATAGEMRDAFVAAFDRTASGRGS